MAERKHSPNDRLTDLDNPTAAFPIGALQRGTLRKPASPRPSAGEEDETERRPLARISIHGPGSRGSDDDEEDYDSRSFVPPKPEPAFDPRWIALGLLSAAGLAAAAVVLAAALVLMS